MEDWDHLLAKNRPSVTVEDLVRNILVYDLKQLNVTEDMVKMVAEKIKRICRF